MLLHRQLLCLSPSCSPAEDIYTACARRIRVLVRSATMREHRYIQECTTPLALMAPPLACLQRSRHQGSSCERSHAKWLDRRTCTVLDAARQSPVMQAGKAALAGCRCICFLRKRPRAAMGPFVVNDHSLATLTLLYLSITIRTRFFVDLSFLNNKYLTPFQPQLYTHTHTHTHTHTPHRTGIF